jgi:hypothetical protein
MLSTSLELSKGYYLEEGRLVRDVPYAPTLELVSFINPKSGYGNVAIALAQALAPYWPVLKALLVEPPIPLDVLMMMSRSRESVQDSVWITTPNDTRWCEQHITQSVLTMWETTHIPDHFKDHFVGASNIFVPCPMNVEAFQEFRPEARVELLTLGVDSEFWGPPVERDWGGPLRFGMVGTMGSRKYSLETFRAFRDAFGERDDVHMEFLSSHPYSMHPLMFEGVTNQTLTIAGGLTREALRDWYRSKHVLLFPSRGEGYGLPPLEMACTGGAVIATNGMGMYWFSSDVGFTIPWKLTQVVGFPDHERGAMWMEPDYDVLVDTLRFADQNRGVVKERARVLSIAVPGLFNWDKTAVDLLGKL